MSESENEPIEKPGDEWPAPRQKVCRNCKWFNMDDYGKTGWGECDSPRVNESMHSGIYFIKYRPYFGCRFFEPKEKN